MTGADYVVAFLKAQGVERVHTLSGGMIAPLLDACAAGGLDVITYGHEQAAGFAAQGEAILTGRPAVAMATSGPGATNLLTPIASCYFDGTPVLFITGQVPTNEQKGTRLIRQLGFQETDIVAVAKRVTCDALRVDDASDIVDTLRGAWWEMLAGRPGPVLVDIPFDAQRAEVPPQRIARHRLRGVITEFSDRAALADLGRVLDLLRDAERPLVLVGNGARGEKIHLALEALGIPVVHSLLGKDVYHGAVGLIGTYGNRWANKALAECDVLLALGTRLDVRQTGWNAVGFAEGKTIIRVDIDADELHDGRVFATEQFPCSVGAFLESLLGEPSGFVLRGNETARALWWSQISEWQNAWPAETELDAPEGHNPNRLLANLDLRGFSSVVVDVGAHQMWAAQSLRLLPGQRFITSGGHGAMGFALPAAIGAALAGAPGRVLVITGDGSLRVNMQEMHTIVSRQLPVKILLFDNGGHAMVRQFQDQLFGGRHVATEAVSPDFVRLAQAFGIPAGRAERRHRTSPWELQGPWHLLASLGPALIHVPVAPHVGIAPKLAFGKGLGEMDPPRG